MGNANMNSAEANAGLAALPKTIWAWVFTETKRDDLMKGGWNDAPDRRETAYIRADLCPDSDYIEHLTQECDRFSERIDDLAAEVIRLTQINAELTAANAALMVRDAEARVMAEFYANELAYDYDYERMPCDCCTDIYKPIERDEGATARAWLAGGAE